MLARCRDRRCHAGYPGGVDSLLSPVGPEPPSVYWKRRALVIGGALLVIIGLIMLWPSGGDAQTTSADTAATPSAAPVPSGSPTPSSATSASAAASASASPSGPATITDCLDSEIEVQTKVDTPAPKMGAPVSLTMTIANISGVPCTRDVGAAVNQFTITSGGYRVWSSDDCNPGGQNQIETIPPGQAFAVQAAWPTVITTPGCPTPQQPAQPGTYDVAGTNGSVTGVATRFSLTP